MATIESSLALGPDAARRARMLLAAWLSCMALLVAAMVIVGGATRLTDSGLSITEWQPLLGAIPPLNEADWQAAFAKYKTIPQATIVNKTMTLAEFKSIYWWEWGHRQLGRFIGIAFALPLALFFLRGMLSPVFARRLALIFALGALQGAVGWFMVKSGLVARIDVSPYRLALHLAIAVVIFAALVGTVLDLRAADRKEPAPEFPAGQARLARLLPPLVLLQMVLGAFVAGNKAGRAYNTWPTMDGQWFPDNMMVLSPWWSNLTENLTTVQFDHRLVAYVVVAVTLLHLAALARDRADKRILRSALVLSLAVIAQAALGIFALLAAVPISLGLAHQVGAICVIALAIAHAHLTCDPASRAVTISG